MINTFTLILIEFITVCTAFLGWSNLLYPYLTQSFTPATRITEGFPIYTPENINPLLKYRYPLVR